MKRKQIIKEQEINFRGHNILVLRKKIKNINLTIRTDGNISLSVPFQLSSKDLYDFLESRADWIDKNKTKFKKTIPLTYTSGEPISYLGIEYTLEIIKVKTNQKIELEGKNFNVYVFEKNINKEYLEKFINNWYKLNLIYIVTDLSEIWAKKLRVEFNEIKVRKLRRTWGSCNTQKKIITYSIELAKKDRKLIEYVVVHELSHLIYANHGREFKNLLNEIMPDWEKRKKELNNMKNYEE